MIDPSQDGITHVNVYSKAKTELGRLLSNFAHTPFTYRNVRFASVEAYWYYCGLYTVLCYNPLQKDDLLNDLDKLRVLHGADAKTFGRALNDKYQCYGLQPDKARLTIVYKQKLLENPRIHQLLLQNTLPLAHYYVMNNKVVDASKYQWTVDLWDEIKNNENNNNRKT